MKKLIIISVICIIMITISFTVINNYNKSTANATSDQERQQAASDRTIVATTEPEDELDFTLKDLKGNDVKLSDYKGKNVYLNFFATWCPPCRGEMPDIEKVYQKYKDKDFIVLAVNLGEDSNTVKDFIDRNKYSFNVLLDSNQTVAEEYNITAIPVSIFINKDGKTIARKVGAMTISEMESYISLLLGK